MISFLSSWVKNLSLALIVVSILEMFLPNNRIKKYVKVIMGLYILISIISPFINDKLDFSNIDFYSYLENGTEVSSTAVNQENMDVRLNRLYIEKLEKDIITKLKNNGYEVEQCNVMAHISDTDTGIEKIVVKVKSKIQKESKQQTDGEESMENKIVSKIQNIKEVQVGASNVFSEETKDKEQEKMNITKTDIKVIKDFLINEYGVDEKCLKIS